MGDTSSICFDHMNRIAFFAVSLSQHAFLVGLCLQTTENYLSKSAVTITRKNQSDRIVNADK